jgi:UPF0755 protein
MRRVLLLLLLVLLVSAAGVGWYGSALWRGIHEPYKGFTSEEQFVEIPPGTPTAAIGRRLVDAGVVRDTLVFRAALWWTGESRNLKAGEYRFNEPLGPIDVIARLTRGDVYTVRITFPEGLTIQEMARLYESRGFGNARDFLAAAEDESLVADLDPRATDLEGYLFPETYTMARNTPAARLIALMVDRFRAVFTDEQRREAEAEGLDVREVVTLASLIEKETGTADERAMVAAVYRNRLNIRMPLQADPTIVYALQKAGSYNGNIRREDLAIDSPYNTYRYPGLPPGPIASPGKASLDAVLSPADVRYLYFVSRNDGTHVFASTLTEHNLNVRRFQVDYFRSQSGGRGQGEGGRAVPGRRR